MKEKIEKIKSYFKEMQVVSDDDNNTVIYIKVLLPNKWVIPEELKTDKMNIVKMNDNSDVFYTDLINGYDILFNAIEYTITKNKEAEERVELFHAKVKELESYFRDEEIPLDKLKLLTFSFEKPKRNKPKTNSFQKENPIIEEIENYNKNINKESEEEEISDEK